ncbi:MAG: lipopolysaccharide kinase InaA family protein, partial [Gemmataceae bacterium]
KLGPRLDWEPARDNLVLINRWFSLRAGRSERRRFWQTYADARGWLPAGCQRRDPAILEMRTRARELEKVTLHSNLVFWHSRDQRCRANNRHIEKLRKPGLAGHAVRGLDRAFLENLLADPDGPFARDSVKTLKDSRSSTVIEMEASLNGKARRLIYKRFRVTHWSEPWRGLVRRTPVLRSWVYGHCLRDRGLPTARPLHVLQRRQAGLDREGYLLAEKIEEAVEMQRFVERLGELPERERRPGVRLLVERLARLIRTLHQRRIAHRDLKAANLLVSGPCDDPQLHFIDLVGIAQAAHLPRQRRIQNLARLNASFLQSKVISHADRLRFLALYRQWGLAGKGGWKNWWRAIARATEKKVARNQKTGRPLA